MATSRRDSASWRVTAAPSANGQSVPQKSRNGNQPIGTTSVRVLTSDGSSVARSGVETQCQAGQIGHKLPTHRCLPSTSNCPENGTRLSSADRTSGRRQGRIDGPLACVTQPQRCKADRLWRQELSQSVPQPRATLPPRRRVEDRLRHRISNSHVAQHLPALCPARLGLLTRRVVAGVVRTGHSPGSSVRVVPNGRSKRWVPVPWKVPVRHRV